MERMENNKENMGVSNQKSSSRQSQTKSRSESKELRILNKKMENQNYQSGRLQESLAGNQRIDYKKVTDILKKSIEQRSMEQVIYIINQLESLEFFHNIYQEDNLKQKYKLIKEMRVEQFHKNGQIIYEEGDQQKKFYVILRGGVKLVKNAIQLKNLNQSNQKDLQVIDTSELEEQEYNLTTISKDQEEILKVFTTGQYFGENELIYNSKRFCTAITYNQMNSTDAWQQQEDTIVGIFCQNTFNNYIQEFVRKWNPFYQSLSLLQLVPKEGKIKLSYYYQKKQLALNETIYKQDSKIDYVYYLEKGSIQLKLQQKEILDVLPHSIMQKKEETQLVCTISEKSFIGDEDLLNLSGTRRYTAVVSSISAVLFFAEAQLISQEIQEAYGSVKANQMISSYLIYKEKWRNQFIESAQKVKSKFAGFSSSPSKINQNLMLKKKSQSKKDLLKFASNFVSDFESNSYTPQQQVQDRCKTESSNYQTIDASVQENMPQIHLNENSIFHINQNHLKHRKNKMHNQPILPQNQFLVSTPSNILPVSLQQYNHTFVLDQAEQGPLPNDKYNQILKNNGAKYHTIDFENNHQSENSLPSYVNLQNHANSRMQRCESITIEEQNGESILIAPPFSSNNLQRSQTLSPTNLNMSKGPFKIRLQKMEENERSTTNDLIHQFGHTSMLLNGKPSIFSPKNNTENKKIYDPFNECWVKKTYPKRNINKIKYQIDVVRAFKQGSKSIGVLESPLSQHTLLNNMESIDPSQYNNFLQGTLFQLDGETPGALNMNKQISQQDFKFSQQSSKIERIAQTMKFQPGGERKNVQLGPSLIRENSENMNSSFIYTPQLVNQQQLNFIDKSSKAQQGTFLLQNNSKINNAEKQQKVRNNSNSTLKEESRNNQSKQNTNSFSKTGKVCDTESSNRNQSYNNKQKAIKSQSFHNNTSLNYQLQNNQSRMRNNSSENSHSSKPLKSEGSIERSINHLNQESKGNSISQERNTNEFDIKQSLLRRLRKSSVEKCRNDDELINQYLNKFIEENCSGNEIYQIESTNFIEKKKQLLKYLLNQIGSPSLNCIDLNEDQKNTKYDHILRGLMRQRQENQRKRDYEEGVYTNKSRLGNYSNFSGGKISLCSTKTKPTELAVSHNFSTTSKSLPQQNHQENNSSKDQKQSKILQNIVSSYIKKRDRDPFKADLQQGSIEEALNELSINRLTQTIPHIPSPFHMGSSIIGLKNSGKSYSMFKQKQELKKKLRQQPQYRSVNGSNNQNQKIDISKLHQTLFIISKDHTTL